MKTYKVVLIIILAVLTLLGTKVLAITGTVNAPSGLVLRSEPSKTATPITTLPDKTQVDILEDSGEWYKTIYNNQEGYIFKEYVNLNEKMESITETTNPKQETNTNEQILSNNKIKVYIMPLITSTVINVIEENVEIKIEKQITNWSYVTSGNIQGWVRTYGIENKQQPIEEQPNTTPEPTQTEEPIDNQETPTSTPADNSNARRKHCNN